jgi:hypothetical protein
MLMTGSDFISMLDHATTGKRQTPEASWDLESTEQQVVDEISNGRWGDQARQVDQEKIPTDIAASALRVALRTAQA